MNNLIHLQAQPEGGCCFEWVELHLVQSLMMWNVLIQVDSPQLLGEHLLNDSQTTFLGQLRFLTYLEVGFGQQVWSCRQRLPNLNKRCSQLGQSSAQLGGPQHHVLLHCAHGKVLQP